MTPNETQLKKVRNHLIKNRRITAWKAITMYRIMRLSAYILILREEMEITSTRIYPEEGNWYTLYKLVE